MNESGSGFSRFIRNIDLVVAGVALAVLVTITVLGVFMRYAAQSPLQWTEEAQLWCFVWIVFLGAGAVARKNGHIAIDAFVGLFPAAMRKFARSINLLVSLAVLAFLGYYSFRYVMQMYNTGRHTNILFIPNYIIYAVAPLSSAVMFLTALWLLLGGSTEAEREKELERVAKAETTRL